MDRAISAIVLALVLMAGAPALTVNAAHAAEDTLIVAQMKYIKNPNPLKEETWYDWWLNLVTFDRLFREGPDLEPHPWLCEFYTVSPDGLVWTFKVVENSKWHDGVPFTARDIAFTVEFYKKYKPPAWYPNVMYVTKVEVVDDYTVKVYLNQTFVWMKRRFGQMIILPEHIWKYVAQVFEDPMRFNPLDSEDVAKVLAVIKKEAPKEIASKVEEFVNKYGHLRIGNGPFMLVRWKEGELLEMVKAPGYFKEGFPRIDRLVYKVYATAQAQYLAVKKGEAHIMVWTVPYAVIEEAEADPNIVLPRTPDVYVGYIGLNMKDPVLENPLVRKAIAHAIDKEKIVSVLMLGYAMPAYTFIHPGYEKWVNPHVPRYEFDLDKANKLLDRAGFKDVDGDGYRETPDGRDFELTIYTPSYDPVRVRIGDLMVEWFKQIGIKLTNRAVDFDTLIDMVYNKHEFQMYIIENDANFQPWYLSAYYTKEQYVPGGNNPYGFVNEKFEELVRAMDAEPDEEKRVSMVYELQSILAEELPLIPLYIRYWMQAYRAELSGVVDMPGGALNFWTLINANFEGKPYELPYTEIVTPTPTTAPTTPAVPAERTVTVTSVVRSTVTVTRTVTEAATVTATVTVKAMPAAASAAIMALLVICIVLAAMYFTRRR